MPVHGLCQGSAARQRPMYSEDDLGGPPKSLA